MRCRLHLDRHPASIFSSPGFPLVVVLFDVSAGFDSPSRSVRSGTPACAFAWFAPFPHLDADSYFWVSPLCFSIVYRLIYPSL